MPLVLIITICLLSCNNGSQAPPVIYPPPAVQISAEDSITREKIKKLIDTVYQIKIETSKKCNLTEGYFVLKNKRLDSASLYLITKHLAAHLFQTTKKDGSCDYKVMSKAMVYLTLEDYSNDPGDYLAICSIDPTNYEGEVYIPAHKLKALKQ